MKLEDIQKVLIVGAGVMGHAIAQVYATNGYEVCLLDLKEDVLKDALIKIECNLNTLGKNGWLDLEKIPEILSRIHTSSDLKTAAKGVSLVLEAVSEVPEIKEKVFAQLSEVCSEDTILASNTSSLNIFKIVKVKKPERLIVHHWFAPPYIIPLVEIVPGHKTSKEVVDLSRRLMEKLGKKPILLNKFTESFIVNKMQIAITSIVSQLMLMDIASPQDIDLAIKYSLGIRLPIVGVVQTLDFTGLETMNDIAKAKGINLGNIQALIQQGHLGVKTSKGLYDYQGRTENEICEKRDKKYMEMLENMEKLKAFEPI